MHKGLYAGTATMENSMDVPEKCKKRITIWPSNSTSGYLPEEIQNTSLKRHMQPYVHCSIIDNSQDMRATTCPWIHEWIKMWYASTMEYYSAPQKKILPLVTTWMDLEVILLSKISQTETDKYHMIFPYMWNLKNNINERTKWKQIHRYREQIDGCWMRGDLGGG